MGKKKRRNKPATSDKIHYIDNEQELVDWAKRNAAKMSPEFREIMYEATEPKEVVRLAKESGVFKERAMLKVASILAQAAQVGMFVTKEEMPEEKFSEFMYNWYLPRMNELHQRSVDWFKYHMSVAAPDIAEQLFAKGWHGYSEYTHSSGNIAYFNVYGQGGILLGYVAFDPSKKTFQIFWNE